MCDFLQQKKFAAWFLFFPQKKDRKVAKNAPQAQFFFDDYLRVHTMAISSTPKLPLCPPPPGGEAKEVIYRFVEM